MVASIPARKLRSLLYSQRSPVMASTVKPARLWKAIWLTPKPLALVRLVHSGVGAIGSHIPGWVSIVVDVAFEQWHQTHLIGRIAVLDDDIQNQTAVAAG